MKKLLINLLMIIALSYPLYASDIITEDFKINPMQIKTTMRNLIKESFNTNDVSKIRAEEGYDTLFTKIAPYLLHYFISETFKEADVEEDEMIKEIEEFNGKNIEERQSYLTHLKDLAAGLPEYIENINDDIDEDIAVALTLFASEKLKRSYKNAAINALKEMYHAIKAGRVQFKQYDSIPGSQYGMQWLECYYAGRSIPVLHHYEFVSVT